MGTSRPHLLNVERYAEITNRSPSSVRAALRRGEIPAVKLGRRWFIRVQDLNLLFDRAAAHQEGEGASK